MGMAGAKASKDAKEQPAKFTLRFKNPETHELLRLVAQSLGMSMNDVAEDFLARELRIAALGLEEQLATVLERLQTYRAADLKRDIAAFAEAEVSQEDPLRARHVESSETPDPLGVVAAFRR